MAVNGFVSIVGAGPGDPGLLTRKAAVRLRRADLVLYDALVDARILQLAPRAQRFFVGKRAGRPAIAQRAIESLMIHAARRGRRVVRLKGGDPFVFGRGGEEALALARAGIAYEVVPGVSSATAAPAAAGIPVTHRGVASAFLVMAAHDEETFRTEISRIEPHALTLVVLMGMRHAAAVAAALIDRGWSRGTPAAVIVDATRPNQHKWVGRLDAIAAGSGLVTGARAGTIVVGDVVALARMSGQPAVPAVPVVSDTNGTKAVPTVSDTGGTDLSQEDYVRCR